MSNKGLILKLADRLHNLSDITTVSKSFADKMWNQTIYIIQKLRNKRVLNTLQNKLIRLIKKQLKQYKEF